MAVVVKQAPPELVRLLKEAQVRDGRRWEAIATAADVPWPTIQGWLRNVPNPPLIGVVRLCAELKIPADQVFEVVKRLGDEQVRELRDELDDELNQPPPDAPA